MNHIVENIKAYYRQSIPLHLRKQIRSFLKKIIYGARFIKVSIFARLGFPLRVVLGAAFTYQKGWHSTNEQYLDIRDIGQWKRLFGASATIKALLAEHVFEHLTFDEMTQVLSICYKYLEEGGTLLIAVPDGNHPDPVYRQHCGINGIGADAADHKQFITFETLKAAALKAEFNCSLLEGYDRNEKLHVNYKPNPIIGRINRTRSNNNPNLNQFGWDFPDSNTSLIALLQK